MMLDSDSHPNKVDAERSNRQPSFVTLTCEATPCHVQHVRQVADRRAALMLRRRNQFSRRKQPG